MLSEWMNNWRLEVQALQWGRLTGWGCPASRYSNPHPTKENLLHQNHLGWFLKNRLSVPSPDPLQSELRSTWHAVSRINHIVDKVAMPWSIQGQSLPCGQEELFYSRGQQTLSVNDKTVTYLTLCWPLCHNHSTLPLHGETFHRWYVNEWVWLWSSEILLVGAEIKTLYNFYITKYYSSTDFFPFT